MEQIKKTMETKRTMKTMLFTLILTFLAIGTFAFTNAVMKNETHLNDKATLLSEAWIFEGADDPLNNDPLIASQYSKGISESCDKKVETVCTLNAPEDPLDNSKPHMNYVVPGTGGKQVHQRITEALSSGALNETVTAFRSE